MLDCRPKFIEDALLTCKQNEHKMTEWEKRFVSDISQLFYSKVELTTYEHNILLDIKNKVK
jgi:hypothetical protein